MIDYRHHPETRFAGIGDLTLESGAALANVTVAYRTWGELDACRDNAVVVCHALTGDANVDEWWPGLIGPGRPLDTDRFFVVASNVVGGCYGSTGPTSIDPATGDRYGADFPAVSIRDMVEAQRRLVDHLGIRSIAAVLGGSMGGMQVLEWAAADPDRVRSIVPIAVGADHSAWCIGISEAQRQAIAADPAYAGGRYDPTAQPERGLSIARQIGMITYRSPESFATKFHRSAEHDRYRVESYLRYQGAELVGRFDANTYVGLTRSMDSHDIGRDRGTVDQALAALTMPATVIGITSDVLYPLAEQRHLAERLPNGRLATLDVPHGHDGFLIETEAVGELVTEALRASQPCLAA